MLSVRNLKVTLDGNTIISGLNLDVRFGELTSIVGPSGSGKTTLLKTLAGIESKTEGFIALDGVPYGDFNEDQKRQFRYEKIGIVDQENTILDDLTARENLLFLLGLRGVVKSEAQAKSDYLLQVLGIISRAQAFPDQLSGGEKQRLAIACALANEPVLLIADEPTSALDDESAGRVLQLFRGLADTLNIAILLVTHDYRVNSYTNNKYDLRDLSR